MNKKVADEKEREPRVLRFSPYILSSMLPIPHLEDPWWGLFTFQRGN